MDTLVRIRARLRKIRRYLFARRQVNNTLNTADYNQGRGDVSQMLSVEAGDTVSDVTLVVHRLEGGTAAVSVGDGLKAARYLFRSDLNAGQTPVSICSMVTHTYTERNTIELLFENACDECIVEVQAHIEPEKPW